MVLPFRARSDASAVNCGRRRAGKTLAHFDTEFRFYHHLIRVFFFVFSNDCLSHIESAFVVTLQLGQAVYVNLTQAQKIFGKVDIDSLTSLNMRSTTG